MSALSWYAGESWTDLPSCVGSMVVRRLCIGLNDYLRGKEREKYLGPHIFAPLGTLGGADREVKRMHLVLDAYAEIQPVLLNGLPLKRQDKLQRMYSYAFMLAHDAIRYRNATSAELASDAIGAAIWHWTSCTNGIRTRSAFQGIRPALINRWVKLILDCCAIDEKAEITQKRNLCELPC